MAKGQTNLFYDRFFCKFWNYAHSTICICTWRPVEKALLKTYNFVEYICIVCTVQKLGFHFAGIGGRDIMIVAPRVTVEFKCTGPGGESGRPTWFLNGGLAETDGGCYRSTFTRAEGLNYTSTLIINGNRTCNTFNIYCIIYKEARLYLHNTTLVVQGQWQSSFSKMYTSYRRVSKSRNEAKQATPTKLQIPRSGVATPRHTRACAHVKLAGARVM